MTRFCLFFLMLPLSIMGQPLQTEFDTVSKLFKSFKYSQVISTADSLLNADPKLDEEKILELLRMKAVSHYSLGQQGLAWNSFEQLLKINRQYKLDTRQNSPKIVKFFNTVRERFTEENKNITGKEENSAVIDTVYLIPSGQPAGGAFLRSAVLPGWGHLYLGQKKKGLYFSIASAAVLSSAIYYIFDTSRKEEDYLNEKVKAKINKRYKDFDQSYQIRNVLLGAYTIFWLYAQYDLSDDEFSYSSGPLKASLVPTVLPHSGAALQLSYSF